MPISSTPRNAVPLNPPPKRTRASRFSGKWAPNHPAPKNGWTCVHVEIEQNETCEMCEWKDICNVYVMDHALYGVLRCGSECANSMQRNPAATARAHKQMRQRLAAQKTCRPLFNACISLGNTLAEGWFKEDVVTQLCPVYVALGAGAVDRTHIKALRRLLVAIHKVVAPSSPTRAGMPSAVNPPGWQPNRNGNFVKRWSNGAQATIFMTGRAAKYRLVVNSAQGGRPSYVQQAETDPALLAAKAEAMI